MKPWLFAPLLLISFLCLAVHSYAAVYQDDMTEAVNNSIQSYYNLQPFPMEAAIYAPLPDHSAFTFASSTQPFGYAQYRIRGAAQVTVGLYSTPGAFVSQVPGTNQYALGYVGESPILGQALFCQADGGVYAMIGGTLHQAHWCGYYHSFVPASNQAPGDLTGYGVNVYASLDSRSWSRIPLTQKSLSFRENSPFVYEQYSASLPAEAVEIRIELNDVTRFPLTDSPNSYQVKNASRFHCLTSVSFHGNDIMLGKPEPLEPEPYPSERSSRPQRDTPDSAPPPEQRASSVSSASYSGPKFEGIIESSTSSSRKSSNTSKSSSSESRKVSARVEQAEAPAGGTQPPEEAVYRIDSASGETKPFTVGVTAYIIVVVVALAAVVLYSTAKKK